MRQDKHTLFIRQDDISGVRIGRNLFLRWSHPQYGNEEAEDNDEDTLRSQNINETQRREKM
jgi:hypothetical protein